MKDQSKKLVSHVYCPSRSRLLRTVWGGAIATVAAGGLLFTASDAAPALRLPDGGRGLPAQADGLSGNVPVRQTETVPERVTMDQVVAVLDRAEQQALEQGPDLSPTTAQAAAELGMLYTTYQMQLSLGVQDDGARLAPPDAVGPAVQVSYEVASAAQPDVVEAEHDQVTFGQLVVAAERLANLLDSSLPDALVDVQRADQHEGHSPRPGQTPSDLPGAQGRQGFSLRENLLDAVTMFSRSTLGYANGRIPAAVLCPLEFAPGHMLRCDAAQQLTTLSDEFEREFGYPIPITDSYRPYLQQVTLASTKPHLAAVPGTSNHGWGLAVDLSDPISGGASREYAWLRVHGPDYGWDNPSWARPGGTKPEPWHFEFFAAGSIPNRAIDPSDVGTWGPAEASGTSGDASPRHEPMRDLEPKDDDSPSGAAAEPAARPAKEPAKGGQRPAVAEAGQARSEARPEAETDSERAQAEAPDGQPVADPVAEPEPEPDADPDPVAVAVAVGTERRPLGIAVPHPAGTEPDAERRRRDAVRTNAIAEPAVADPDAGPDAITRPVGGVRTGVPRHRGAGPRRRRHRGLKGRIRRRGDSVPRFRAVRPWCGHRTRETLGHKVALVRPTGAALEP